MTKTTKRKAITAAAVLVAVVLFGLLPGGIRVASILSAVAGALAGWYGKTWNDNTGRGDNYQTT